MSDHHLGDLAAALADNELSADARDKALAHLAGCAECRFEVDGQRRLRSLLANQADPELPSDLAARLRSVAADAGTPIDLSQRRSRRWPLLAAASFAPATSAPSSNPSVPTGPAGVRRPRLSRPGERPGRARRSRTVRRALAGSAVALALTAGLASAGGPTASGGPAKTPPVDRFVQEYTVMTARLPFGDAGAGVVESVVLGR